MVCRQPHTRGGHAGQHEAVEEGLDQHTFDSAGLRRWADSGATGRHQPLPAADKETDQRN